MKFLALSLSLLLACPCPAQQPSPSPTPHIPGMEIANVVIGKGGDRDLHAELAWPTTPPKTPMPAIVYIHGGGWYSGDYKANLASSFVKKGYFTASVEYRLVGEAKWPAQIEDCKLAIRWLRANAAKYNIDPNRIGVWGISAGGHLVALLGTTDNHPEFEGKGGYPGISSKVQAVVDWSGPTDMRDGTFTTGSEYISEKDKPGDAMVIERLMGKTYAEHPELWAQASPIIYVHKDIPPFLITHGDKDPTVSYQQSKSFAEALQKAGATVQFVTVERGGHNLITVPGDQPASPNYEQVYATMHDFFDKHLKQ